LRSKKYILAFMIFFSEVKKYIIFMISQSSFKLKVRYVKNKKNRIHKNKIIFFLL